MTAKAVLSVLALLVCLVSSVAADIDFDINSDQGVTGAASGTSCTNTITASAHTLTGWIRVVNTPNISSSCGFNGQIIRDTGRLTGIGLRSLTVVCTQSNDSVSDEVTTAVTTGWHSVIGVHTGGNLLLYLDGVSAGTVASGNSVCTTDTFQYGTRTNNRVAGLMIYNVALGAEEINAIAKRRQHGPVRTMPTVDMRLTSCPDGTSGDAVTFPDYSGNGRSGVGDDGASNTGLTCRASEFFRREWGPQ